MITNLGIIGNPLQPAESAAALAGRGVPLRRVAVDRGVAQRQPRLRLDRGLRVRAAPGARPGRHIYPAYEGMPNGGNRPGSRRSRTTTPTARWTRIRYNGKDDDGDGLIDEDYAAISQQMFSCEYWDYTDEARTAYPEHRPLNLRVRQESYAWSTEGANEFVGFDFKIVNDGFEMLRQVYLGFFVDSDVGPKERRRLLHGRRRRLLRHATRPSSTVRISYQCARPRRGRCKPCASRSCA